MAPDHQPRLTEREREVLELLARGLSTREVAATLAISFGTARAHREHIMAKFGVHTTVTLVVNAIRLGLVR